MGGSVETGRGIGMDLTKVHSMHVGSYQTLSWLSLQILSPCQALPLTSPPRGYLHLL